MKENNKEEDLILDDTITNPIMEKINLSINNKKNIRNKVETKHNEKELINCLRNEIIIARYLNKTFALSQDPKHVFAGNMAENAFKSFTLPMTNTGALVNPLTSEEQEYLEFIMGLENNALSVYSKQDNYWENINVKLKKEDTYFNLSNPDDFIKYKILLVNDNFIAKNLSTFEQSPKATYQYVLISELEQMTNSNVKMNVNMTAYKLLGAMENNIDKLKFIVSIMSGKSLSANTKDAFIQAQAHELLQLDPKLFVSIAEDKLLDTKILISKGIDMGLIRKRADYYYLVSNNTPLALGNDEPTLESAAKYLSNPKNQELKFLIEAKTKK